MKVKELIEELKGFDQELLVVLPEEFSSDDPRIEWAHTANLIKCFGKEYVEIEWGVESYFVEEAASKELNVKKLIDLLVSLDVDPDVEICNSESRPDMNGCDYKDYLKHNSLMTHKVRLLKKFDQEYCLIEWRSA